MSIFLRCSHTGPWQESQDELGPGTQITQQLMRLISKMITESSPLNMLQTRLVLIRVLL